MGATILPFPLLDGAQCMVETRANHRHRDINVPKQDCTCLHCDRRRSELMLAARISRELEQAKEEEAHRASLTSLLEKGAG